VHFILFVLFSRTTERLAIVFTTFASLSPHNSFSETSLKSFSMDSLYYYNYNSEYGKEASYLDKASKERDWAC
jgi:hypothetical protein